MNGRCCSCWRLQNRFNVVLCCAVVFLVIGLTALAVDLGLYFVSQETSYEYGIVMDAGSSHTSLYVYHWDSNKVNNTGDVKEIHECQADGGGISDYYDKPSDAGASIEKCLQSAVEVIPWAIRQYSPIYLGATAGMRPVKFYEVKAISNPLEIFADVNPKVEGTGKHFLLSSPQVVLSCNFYGTNHLALTECMKNSSISDQIMASVRNEILKSPFQVTDSRQQVQIISGRDEGIGLWITANYVAGSIGDIFSAEWPALIPDGHSSTLGVLDLGGASTQITFAVNNKVQLPPKYQQKVTLYNQNLALFSDSFLCYGAGEMRRQLLGILSKEKEYSGTIDHPCYAKGYKKSLSYSDVFDVTPCTDAFRRPIAMNTTMTFVGVGDNDQCHQLISKLFNRSVCTFPQCSFDAHPLPKDIPDKFLARGAFAYTLDSLGILEDLHTTYPKFKDSLDKWCNKNNSEILASDVSDPSTVCTNGHYIDYLLTNIYEMTPDKWSNIIFSNKLRDISMGWSLGYMTNITSTMSKVPRLKLFAIGVPVFAAVLAIAIVLLLIAIGLFVHAFRVKRQYQLLRNQISEPF